MENGKRSAIISLFESNLRFVIHPSVSEEKTGRDALEKRALKRTQTQSQNMTNAENRLKLNAGNRNVNTNHRIPSEP